MASTHPVNARQSPSHATSLGLVISDYYRDIAQGLLHGAVSVLDQHAAIHYEIAHVSGAWELPLIVRVMAQTQRFQAMIALGCIIRGETSHYDLLCEQCADALMAVSMEHSLPVGFGVLTVENYVQAEQRSSIENLQKNKGCEAAIGVLRSIDVISDIRRP